MSMCVNVKRLCYIERCLRTATELKLGQEYLRSRKKTLAKNEPRHEKRSGLRPGPTQTRLYSYRRWLEA